MSPSLHDLLCAVQQENGPGFYKHQVPASVYQNLNQRFTVRPYQEEAFGRFVYYFTSFDARSKQEPTQLLFHMATGSGKTLIMAGLMLYLYQKGYRNFLFFVNSTNIIEKTRDNFLSQISSKYLFAQQISLDGKQIQVKEVDNFEASNDDDIHIVFSTIQGLHTRLTTPKENSLTWEDFEDQKIVFISDEAHHINTETKKGSELSNEEREAIASWEGTVRRIVYANAENVLLEFTATADFTNPLIASKYHPKLLFDYPLKAFRADGYSKEVNVLQADLEPWQRSLQAIILSQYRRKVFEKWGKPIKPVILFKSKRIKESRDFQETFVARMQSLQPFDLTAIQNATGDAAIRKAFEFFEANGISMDNLVMELQEDFSEGKLVSVNSKEESEEKQLAIHSLEDERNPYRAVFAVDKLNEGWDVLNLFDIVRLYDSRDVKSGKRDKTTIAEAQLIGRGARYCPFFYKEGLPPDKRKFDDNPEHALRICESLYYHSAYNPKYIQELNTALEEIGIKATDEEQKKKGAISKARLHAPAHTSSNKTKRSDGLRLPATIRKKKHKVYLHTGYTQSGLLSQEQNDRLRTVSKEYRLIDFGVHLVRSAINKLPFYQFANLKRHLPELPSISAFITLPDYLGSIRLEVYGLEAQLENLTQKEKLDITIRLLEQIAERMVGQTIDEEEPASLAEVE